MEVSIIKFNKERELLTTPYRIRQTNMSQKQAVKVVIRTRPTADFASKNVEIDLNSGAITLKQDKNEAAGIINNQTDVWKFNFEKILHNAS